MVLAAARPAFFTAASGWRRRLELRDPGGGARVSQDAEAEIRERVSFGSPFG